MSKKLQLHIAEPCHENWDSMSPVDRGRFCDACQKQVVDFSTMSDREIVQFFKKPSTGSVCGRFMNEQLDRDMVTEKKRLPWIKYFFQIVFPAFVISKQAYTQGMLIRRTPPVADTPTTAKDQLKKIFSLTELKITVTDSATHLPIPYASIRVVPIYMDSNFLNDLTKADGSAIFQLNSNQEVDITISSVGYTSARFTIRPGEFSNDKPFKVALKVDVKTMEEVTVVSSMIKGRITAGYVVASMADTTRTYSAKDNGLPPQPKVSSSKIYPNPVKRGDALTIEFESSTKGAVMMR